METSSILFILSGFMAGMLLATYLKKRSIHAKLNFIIQNQIAIMAKQSEHAQALRDAAAQAIKAKEEILKKIDALETASGDTTPEVDQAFSDLRQSVQGVDDIVPDEVIPPDDTEKRK